MLKNRPYSSFIVGMFLCGIKFPFNWLSRENEQRQSAMERTSFGILPANDGTEVDKPMIDAWERIATGERLSHDLTNLVVEWTRRWVPYSTKFFCSLIVFGYPLMHAYPLFTHSVKG